ncbi:cell-surface polysaccharide exporter protein PST family [Brucella intermedia 229E]|uniref:Cell-surface polysaccharide exporter protein PST family n=1 Tax=Brucella intermedia 229E TaxID=1337887 RepID=U4V0Z6_9HYPH|nr:cell-surface polysaccharide exporter protein PST family [Brucella intermedia 229E]
MKRHWSTLLSYAASSGSLFAANIAQLFTFALLARYLGSHEFGLFVTVMAVTNIATFICGLGGAECLVRRVAQDRTIYPAMLGHNLILIAITGIVLVAAGMIILPLWLYNSPEFTGNLFGLFLLLVTNIVLMRLILLVEQIYIAHTDFVSANLSVVGFAIARTIAAAIACLLFGVSTVVGWAYWQFGAHVLVAVVYALFLRRLGRPQYTIVRDEIRLGVMFASQFIFKAVRQNADLLLLGTLMPPSVVGSYGVTRRIIDSSTLTVEAMNRLVYPHLARASANGIHHALPITMRLLGAAFAIGILTSLAVFIIAPYLPYLFGSEYDTLVSFCRTLCWITVFVALWSIAVDLLGAASQHSYRTAVLNTGNILGAPLLALATWYAPITGTFAAIYAIEISIVLASWGGCVIYLVRRSRDAEEKKAVSTVGGA